MSCILHRFWVGSAFLWLLSSGVQAQINVVTQHYNLSRTGANLQETILNTSNVNITTFGLLRTYPVQGQVYAQPLYVAGVSLPGITGKKNILYVATMHDIIYAFDADQDTLYWSDTLGKPVSDILDMTYGDYDDIVGEVGICSTPVIDTVTGTIYVEAKNESSSRLYTDSLHALDLATGGPKFGGSEFISASVPGTAYASGGTVHFISGYENQRAGLLLSGGVVYLCFASYGDGNLYEGWILGYNARDIREQEIVFNTDPNGATVNGSFPYARAGIWMSGQGPAVDSSGHLYVLTGNGAFDSTEGNDFADSFLKLTPDTVSKTLKVADWFTPFNQSGLDSFDMDIGSDGPLLIPGTHYLTASSKQGIIYLIDENNMGRFHKDTDLVREKIYAFGNLHIFGSAVYWADSAADPYTGLAYWWGQGNRVSAFRFYRDSLDRTPSAQGIFQPNGYGIPGAILCLSAQGSMPGSAILWATTPISESAQNTVPGYLIAFDASDVTRELWNSQKRLDSKGSSLDSVGNFAKFCPPVVDNGTVYVATFSNQVQAYGLRVVLPVDLVDFTASRVDSSVLLNWVTASERNNDRFEVERSPDGKSFLKLGTVRAAGNSATRIPYSFEDGHPEPGINFYRLKQVDLDGRSAYSRVESVDFGGRYENDFAVFPNPARDHFSIRLGPANPSRITLRMVSLSGVTLFQQVYQSSDLKDNTITVQRNQAMGEGYYILFLTDGSGVTRSSKILLDR